MQRVLVIGSGGAGKSRFSRELAARTGLPLVHLDTLFWKPGWSQTPREEWEAVVRGVIAGDSWILDGNYGGTLELRLAAADTAILLDVSRLTCVRRAISRWLRYRNRSRPDLAAGCPENLDLEFLRWIWSYPAKSRPGVVEKLAAFERRGGTGVVLRDDRDARAFLDAVPTAPGARPAAVSIAGK